MVDLVYITFPLIYLAEFLFVCALRAVVKGRQCWHLPRTLPFTLKLFSKIVFKIITCYICNVPVNPVIFDSLAMLKLRL